MERLIEDLAEQFKKRDYRWKFADGQKVPEANDIAYVLDSLYRHLLGLDVAEGEQPQAELGRLIVKRRDEHFDVFLHIGEINEDS